MTVASCVYAFHFGHADIHDDGRLALNGYTHCIGPIACLFIQDSQKSTNRVTRLSTKKLIICPELLLSLIQRNANNAPAQEYMCYLPPIYLMLKGGKSGLQGGRIEFEDRWPSTCNELLHGSYPFDVCTQLL